MNSSIPYSRRRSCTRSHAILRIAEDGHLAVDVLVVHPFHPRQHLAEGLEALDVRAAQRPQPLPGLAQEVQQARLALLARLLRGSS